MIFSDSAIKTAYEQDGMTPAQIAEDLGFSEVGIKTKLMQVSSKYRKDCGKEGEVTEEDPTLNFSEEQLRVANNVIYETMQEASLPDGSPDHRTRLKAAMYVRDDKKGRKELVKAVQNAPSINLLQQFNIDTRQARELAEQARAQVQQQRQIAVNV